jgi:tRNA(fMet)-specific endonuclease VapC
VIYLLDTNAWINFLNQGPNPIKERLVQIDDTAIRFCSVVKAELLYGAENSSRRDENLETLNGLFAGTESFSFDDRAAVQYSKIRADLAKAGTPIGPNDLMIAAIALAHQVTLVTHNMSEFSRVAGLRIEDWER